MRKSLIIVLSVALAIVVLAAVGSYGYSHMFSTTVPASSPSDTHETLVIRGSDTEEHAVTALAKAFMATHPNATIIVQGGGSNVGVTNFLNKSLSFLDSSRRLTPQEFAVASSSGLHVQEFVLAHDAVAFIVHPSNPITHASFSDIARMFSGEAMQWNAFGGAATPIDTYSPPDDEATHTFVHATVLKTLGHAHTLQFIPNEDYLVDTVAADENSIGFLSVGFVRNADGSLKNTVKVLPISENPKGPFLLPTDEAAVRSGAYPLARIIYQYTADVPQQGSLAREFITFEFSDDGQQILKNHGLYVLNPQELSTERAKLR